MHMHDAHAHTAAIIATVLFRMKTPLVLSRRVDFPVKNNWLSRYKYNHSSIARIVCVSNAIKEITSPSIKNKSVLTVVHSGVNPNRFKDVPREKRLHKEFGLDSNVKIVGNTSAIADHKDYPTFLKVASQFRDRKGEIAFFIVGDGPLSEQIHDMAKEENLQGLVFFTGFRNDIPVVLHEFDIFLMPSKSEGLGTSLLDAMSCEVPIVSTRAGGIPEIIEHGVTGLISEPGDVQDITDNVNKLLTDSQLRDRVVSGALSRVAGFSSAVMAEKTLKVYKQV